MLRGLATISYYADDVEAAKAWYSDLLGIEPYFVRPVEGPPAYVEFRLGDYQHELGIIDRRYAPPAATTGPAGVVAFWHVDDLRATYEQLLALGATAYEPPVDREAGFITASVIDPFGNILGIMYNPHYLNILSTMKTA
jgi:predicted enzyme related to lactoylglutathione lyase